MYTEIAVTLRSILVKLQDAFEYINSRISSENSHENDLNLGMSKKFCFDFPAHKNLMKI